jgi:hypothetical protein
MRRVLLIVGLLPTAGCHLLTGFDDLTLRDGANHTWSARYGDELPQAIDDVVVSSGRVRIAGSFEGAIELGDESLTTSEPTRFIAQLDGRGEADWALAFDPAVRHHGHIASTTRLTISHDEPVEIAGVSFDVSDGTAFEVIDVDVDGAGAELVFDGTASTLADATVVQEPGEPSVLALGATYEGTLSIDEMVGMNEMECPDVTSEDQSFAVARIEERECRWLKTFGDDQQQWLDAIAVQGGGDIVLGGRFLGNVQVGEGLTSRGGIDYFLIKLSEDGEHLWSHRFGDSTDRDQRPMQLVVRPSGTILAAGYFEGTIDFGSGPITSSLGHDIFVAKFDPSGDNVWTRHLFVRNDAPADPEQADDVLTTLSLEVDNAGNTLVAGHFRGEVDFGGTVRATDGDLNVFLIKLNVDGLLEWSDSFGDTEDQCNYVDCVTALAVDSTDSIFLAGGFLGSINFGGDDLDSAGESDAFIAKFER